MSDGVLFYFRNSSPHSFSSLKKKNIVVHFIENYLNNFSFLIKKPKITLFFFFKYKLQVILMSK